MFYARSCKIILNKLIYSLKFITQIPIKLLNEHISIFSNKHTYINSTHFVFGEGNSLFT